MGNSKSGKTVGNVYRRNKNQFETEKSALDSILKKYPKERQNNLVAAHTEKQWVFKAKTDFD
jgi:hypothetical protein